MLEELIAQYLQEFKAASKSRKLVNTVKALEDMKTRLAEDPPASSEVVSYFDAIVVGDPLPGSSLAFVAAWYSLSSEYCEPLCRVLELESARDFHEPSVELLGQVGDVVAVPALKKSLGYRWDYDQWMHIPRKALRALYRIGGQEGHAIIEEALRSSDQLIRDEARLILKDEAV